MRKQMWSSSVFSLWEASDDVCVSGEMICMSGATMRPCTQLLSLLLLSITTSGVCGENCSEEIMVHRYQLVLAHWGHRLEVECPVTFCPNKTPAVFWIKYANMSDKANTTPTFETRWAKLTETTGVSYLVFSHLLLNDSGDYRCETNSEKGHYINITVLESAKVTTVIYTSAEPSSLDMLQPYLYSAAGIVVCVVVVIIVSVLSMQRCPGSPKTTPEYEHTAMPMTHRTSARSNPGQAPPSYAPLSAQHTTQKPSTANQMSQNGRLFRNRQEAKEEEEDEEDPSVCYVTLNHGFLVVTPEIHDGHEQATEVSVCVEVSCTTSTHILWNVPECHGNVHVSNTSVMNPPYDPEIEVTGAKVKDTENLNLTTCDKVTK